MKIEIFNGNWTINDVRSNPNKIFVFGDNDRRFGKGGQAIIRGLLNTIGLRTKKEPSNKSSAYYNDSDFYSNSKNILEDILEIKSKLLQGYTIVFSSGGYGTGLAFLSEKAPRTFDYLCRQLKEHFNFNNKTGRICYEIPGNDRILNAKYVDFDDVDIIKPINNSFFRHESLSNSINTNYGLITSCAKVSFTSSKTFKPDDVIIIRFVGFDDYLVCRVIDSYDISTVIDRWHFFEGYDESFTLDECLIDSKFQTHFQFIYSLDINGKMMIRNDFFKKS